MVDATSIPAASIANSQLNWINCPAANQLFASAPGRPIVVAAIHIQRKGRVELQLHTFDTACRDRNYDLITWNNNALWTHGASDVQSVLRKNILPRADRCLRHLCACPNLRGEYAAGCQLRLPSR